MGLNEETTCYVSLDYFRQNDPFGDYVLHEVAHIFHNCKREWVGLPRTRSREWLLDISYKKRELFAYACEVYGRILERANGTAERRADLTQYAQTMAVDDDRVNKAELLGVLAEAIEARNGWNVF